MLYLVEHLLSYRYDRPVFLEPHLFRLRPHENARQRLDEFELDITPTPAGRTEHQDVENNPVEEAWFGDLTKTLEVKSRFRLRTTWDNPFNYLVTDEEFTRLPADYPREVGEALGIYRTRAGCVPEIADFARQVVAESGDDTLSFLATLNRILYEQFEVIVRMTGDPLPAVETLQGKRASCRDLAVLFMAVSRAQGLAARFVSGYQCGDPDQAERHLHAWPEVYIPGGGWRGYDPTQGLAVTGGNIILAASHHPQGAAPITGNFRGSALVTEFSYDVRVRFED